MGREQHLFPLAPGAAHLGHGLAAGAEQLKPQFPSLVLFDTETSCLVQQYPTKNLH